MFDKLLEMKTSGELSPYLYDCVAKRIAYLPPDMQQNMLADAVIMTGVGVESADDHKNFMHIAMHVKTIVNDISIIPVSTEDLSKISSIVFEARYKHTIDTIYNFYRATRRAMQEIGLPIKKLAYPIGSGGTYPDKVRNVPKWMNAMREIYARTHRGFSFEKAFNKITVSWDVMEKQDFKGWMRYYQEDTHKKYKTANDYYQAEGDGPPLIPMRDLGRAKLPSASVPNMDMFKPDSGTEEEEKKEKLIKELKTQEDQELIELRKKQLISRLTSAERLFTGEPGFLQKFNEIMDIDAKEWLNALMVLKQNLLLARVASPSSPILEDLMTRKGNQLKHSGHIRAGNLLISLAQQPVQEPQPAQEGLPPMPEDEEFPEDGEPDAELNDKAMRDFVRMMNGEHITDGSSVEDEEDLGDIVVEAQASPASLEELVAPIPEEPKAPKPQKKPKAPMPSDDPLMGPGEDIIEVEEPADSTGPSVLEEGGDALDFALNDVTMEHVIERLELVSNIIQNREIPRQLSFADMMMGKLGIATFFPSLGEAIRSALESHQYMYTRIEEILSKLRGSLEPIRPIELTTNEELEGATEDTLEGVRQSLKESDKREKDRRDKRKKMREAKEETEVAPQPPPPPEKELTQPIEVEQAPPIRATK